MNLLAFFELLAQATPTSGPSGRPGWMEALNNPVTPILLIMVVFYFFMSKSKRTQEKSRKVMLSELKRGDRITTIGGVHGTVVDVEDAKVRVKVDESNNTKVWFSRSAIHRVETDVKEVVKT